MIYVIDHVKSETYEIYGEIGFRRYEYVSRNEAIKRYRKEIKECG